MTNLAYKIQLLPILYLNVDKPKMYIWFSLNYFRYKMADILLQTKKCMFK